MYVTQLCNGRLIYSENTPQVYCHHMVVFAELLDLIPPGKPKLKGREHLYLFSVKTVQQTSSNILNEIVLLIIMLKHEMKKKSLC